MFRQYPLVLALAATILELFGATAYSDDPQLQPTHANVPYSEHAPCQLDIWIAEGDGPRPLLVYIHGGGWTTGNKTRTPAHIQPFLDKGISYAAINYRHAPQHPLPAPVHDATRAIQYLKSRAGEWSIRKDRFVLTGSSAGACTSMWLLFHDDMADPNSEDPVLRESTRVSAAAVVAGQTAIDPKMIEPWLGPNVLKHRMIWFAVGAKNMQDALDHYDQYQQLYTEFSPINHLTSDDPPLLMTYPEDMSLPSKSSGHGIHHGMYGVKVKEMAAEIGTECHLLIPGTSDSNQYDSVNAFIFDKLLAP